MSLYSKSPYSSQKTSRGGRSVSRSHVPSVTTEQFVYGLLNYPVPQKVPRGAAVDPTINFLTRGTKIEIRNGYAPLGTEVDGSAEVSNIITAHKWDGTEILFKANGNSLSYWDTVNVVWVEVGANILTGNAGEKIWFAEYMSPAGAQLWVSSTHSDLIKIMTANPGSYASQYLTSKNFKGSIAIKKSAMFLWDYLSGTLGSTTKNTLQRSYVDAQAYTTVTNEAIGTVAGNPTFVGTLAFKVGNARATCFGIVINDSATAEQFVDDYMGNLVGSHGSTGTINYMTGAYSFTYNSIPANGTTITATYQTEDSTNNGIADFTKSATRTSGQGVSFLQDSGGAILNTFTLEGTEYVLHERCSWFLTISSDDSTSTQDIFREHMTLASPFGAVATPDGIYYVDTTDNSRPYIAIIKYSPVSNLAYPSSLSDEVLDLASYAFDQCVAYEWDNFILFACRTKDSIVNNRILLFNKEISSSKIAVFDLVDFFANCFATFSGALLAGDSATINVFNLFANFDDDGAIPNAVWTGGIDELGISTLKKVRKFWIEGEIDVGQVTNVNVQKDRGGFVTIGQIRGDGSYVDQGTPVTVGSVIVGFNPVGGGLSNEKTSQHYLAEIRLNLGTFQNRQIQFATQSIGYFSVTSVIDQDIIYHQDKLPQKYRKAV